MALLISAAAHSSGRKTGLGSLNSGNSLATSEVFASFNCESWPNSYMRGALEHATAAWLPAASRSHVELIERELRAAARAVTSSVLSTPAHAVITEARLPTAWARRAVLATRMVGASCPKGRPPQDVGRPPPRYPLPPREGHGMVGCLKRHTHGARRPAPAHRPAVPCHHSTMDPA